MDIGYDLPFELAKANPVASGEGMNDAKHSRFVRLAEKRTQKVLDMLDLIGNLSSKINYDYTESEVQQIFDAIRAKTEEAQERFNGQAEKKKLFTLRDDYTEGK